VFDSNVCKHSYHLKCILDWLERRANKDCPCCRQPLVSESDIWAAVKQARKEKAKQAKKQRKKESCWFVASEKNKANDKGTRNENSNVELDEDGDSDDGTSLCPHQRQDDTTLTMPDTVGDDSQPCDNLHTVDSAVSGEDDATRDSVSSRSAKASREPDVERGGAAQNMEVCDSEPELEAHAADQTSRIEPTERL
jgi:hypothetical protein